jgi:hypothetical protein
MSTITQRKKLSKGTWAFLITIFVAIIIVAVLAFLGYISLAFISDWELSVMDFGATGWVNATLVFLAPFALGAIVCWAAYRWFIGQKVTVATGYGTGYNPQPTTPSQPQSGNETVIS